MDNTIEKHAILVNPGDQEYGYKPYIVTVECSQFIAWGHCEQDAIDEVIDCCERLHYDGLIRPLNDNDLDDQIDEYIIGGNHSLLLTAGYVAIQAV